MVSLLKNPRFTHGLERQNSAELKLTRPCANLRFLSESSISYGILDIGLNLSCHRNSLNLDSILQKSRMERRFLDIATSFDRLLHLRHHEDGNILSADLYTYRLLHSSCNPPPPSISDLGEYSNNVRRTHFPFCFGWKTLRASILKICQKLFLPPNTA